MPFAGELGLYTSNDGCGQIIESIGCTIPKELQGDATANFRELSPENYSELNSLDYLFVMDFQGAADTLKQDPTFQSLVVVKENRVIFLFENVGTAMSIPNPLTIPWAVENIDKAIS